MTKKPRPKHPETKTKRLLLRPIQETDLDTMHNFRNDERLNRYIDRPDHADKTQVLDWMNKVFECIKKEKCLHWVMVHRQSNRVIGTICLWNYSKDGQKAEVGFELHPGQQGKGFMQEALMAVIQLSRDVLNRPVIEGFTHIDNIASRRLLRRTGFKATAIIEENSKITGQTHKMIVYSLTTDIPSSIVE